MSDEVVIPYTEREWQRIASQNRKRWTVLVLHRRAGKTEWSLMELLTGALNCTEELGLFAYVAPRRNQAKTIAWARLKQICHSLIATGHCTVNESELYIQFAHNKATIRLFGADNPDALRGIRLDDCVLDEVAQMKPDTFYEVVRPALADRRGWCVFIGTVKGVDLFSEINESALDNIRKGAQDWFVGNWTCYQTEALPSAEISEIKDQLSEQAFSREMLNDFTARGDDQLISLADVQRAVAQDYAPVDYQKAPRVMGVDPARFGDDRSVIVRRQGLMMFDPIVRKDIDNMALASLVAHQIAEWKPHAVFVDAGAGSGVIDRLRQLGHSIIEVPFGGKAHAPTRYKNRRSEMWFTMRDWIKEGGSIPDDMALKRELATPTYWLDDAGRACLEQKEKIKERLPQSGSPDLADALALTLAANVAVGFDEDVDPYAGHPVLAQDRRKQAKREWSPFSRAEQQKRFQALRRGR